MLNIFSGVGDFFSPENLLSIFAGLICFMIALPVHECAHGYVAYKLGDPTAKNMGRLTLNPIKHMDIFGTICIVLFGIGWAKPVQINPYNFKNPKKGMAISAAAGPISNIMLALVFLIFQKATYALYLIMPEASLDFMVMLQVVLEYIVLINLTLAIFNLIPIPPFDGSRIANYFLPERTYFKVMQYEQYIMIGIMLLIFSGALDGPLGFLTDKLYFLIDKMTFFMDFFVNVGA